MDYNSLNLLEIILGNLSEYEIRAPNKLFKKLIGLRCRVCSMLYTVIRISNADSIIPRFLSRSFSLRIINLFFILALIPVTIFSPLSNHALNALAEINPLSAKTSPFRFLKI